MSSRGGRAKGAFPRGERETLLLSLAEVFSLLSEVFLEPEADVKVRLGQLLERCPEDCPDLLGLPAALRRMVRECVSSQQQGVEYVRLFLHGRESRTVHLYESVHLRERMMAPEILDSLQELQRQAGIRPREGVSLPPDHLGLELELLAHALARCAGSGPRERGRWRSLAATLTRGHLVPFVRSVGRRLGEASPHPYYHAAGEALVEGLQACVVLLDGEGGRRGPLEAPEPGEGD